MADYSQILDFFEDINPDFDRSAIPQEDVEKYDEFINAFIKFCEAQGRLSDYMNSVGLNDDEYYQAWDEYCDELTNPEDMENFAYHFCESLVFARARQ